MALNDWAGHISPLACTWEGDGVKPDSIPIKPMECYNTRAIAPWHLAQRSLLLHGDATAGVCQRGCHSSLPAWASAPVHYGIPEVTQLLPANVTLLLKLTQTEFLVVVEICYSSCGRGMQSAPPKPASA